MKKSENPFRIFYNHAYDYFTDSVARRVVFFAIVAIMLCALFTQINPSWLAEMLLVFSVIIFLCATLIDSIQNRRAFLNQLKDLEADYAKRAYEKDGEAALASVKTMFSLEEVKFMRRKKREYNYTIFVKFVFLVIFVVLFINLF